MLHETLKEHHSGFLKQAADEQKKKAETNKLGLKVYQYLIGDYPKETLDWVKSLHWEKKELPLDSIKMGRRPGGARETDKTNAIRDKYKAGETLDPVVVVLDGAGEYRIADGYHRTLGRKKAGFDTIEAYVAQTEEVEGPWKHEMHDRKLSKGIKKAAGIGVEDMYDYNPLRGKGTEYLEKEAKFGFIGNVAKAAWGGNKRKAKKMYKDNKPSYTKAKQMKRSGLLDNETFKDFKSTHKGLKSDARRESMKTFGARAGIAGVGTAGYGTKQLFDASSQTNDFQDQQKELDKQRREIEERYN